MCNANGQCKNLKTAMVLYHEFRRFFQSRDFPEEWRDLSSVEQECWIRIAHRVLEYLASKDKRRC